PIARTAAEGRHLRHQFRPAAKTIVGRHAVLRVGQLDRIQPGAPLGLLAEIFFGWRVGEALARRIRWGHRKPFPVAVCPLRTAGKSSMFRHAKRWAWPFPRTGRSRTAMRSILPATPFPASKIRNEKPP